jgi:hypothetical protein
LEIWQWKYFVLVGRVEINASVAAVHVAQKHRGETKGWGFPHILANSFCIVTFLVACGWISVSTTLLSLLQYTGVDIDFNFKPKIKVIVCHFCPPWKSEYAVIKPKVLRVEIKVSGSHRVCANFV